jgi:hypothetical protein
MNDYVKRWFLVENDGDIEKREYECQYVPEHKGYIVKLGCIRDFVPEVKTSETEKAADTKLKELQAETKSV